MYRYAGAAKHGIAAEDLCVSHDQRTSPARRAQRRCKVTSRLLLIGRISKCDTAGHQPHRLDASAQDFRVAALMLDRSLPAINGAASISHKLKVCAILGIAHAAVTDFQHVGIIPVARPA